MEGKKTTLECAVAIHHYFLSVRKKYISEEEARNRLDKKNNRELFEVLEKSVEFEESFTLSNITKHIKNMKLNKDKLSTAQYFRYKLPGNFQAIWNTLGLMFYLFLSGIILVILSHIFPEYSFIILVVGLVNTSLAFMLHLNKRYDLYWLIRRVGEREREKSDLTLLKNNQDEKIKYWEMIVCSKYMLDTFDTISKKEKERLTEALQLIINLKTDKEKKNREMWRQYMSKSYSLGYKTFQNILESTSLKSYPEYFSTIEDIHQIIRVIVRDHGYEK